MKRVSLFLLLTLTLSSDCFAGTFFKFGTGIFLPNNEKIGNVKLFSVGYEEPLFYLLDWKLEAGGFSDSKSNNDRRGSLFASIGPGVSVNGENFYSKVFWSAGGITGPDAMLGGPFEFFGDVELGLKDPRGNSIGFDYKHISSAGIYNINHGRDFLLIKVEIKY